MPLVRISLPQGKSPEYARSIGDCVHQAMVETIAVPAADKFQLISEETTRVIDPAYLGIERSADAIIVQITLNGGRTLDMKKKLFARIAELLGERVRLRKEDVMVSLVEVAVENWSFGNGESQYADRARPAVKRVAQPEGLFRYPTFSQVVEVAAPRLVVVSGQVAVDESGKLVGPGDIEAQTRQVFKNLQSALKGSGLDLPNLVKITSFLRSMKDLPGYRKVRSEFLPESALPTSTLVEAHLVDDSYLIEVEAIAAG